MRENFTHCFVTANGLTAIDFINPYREGEYGAYSNETLKQIQARYPGATVQKFDDYLANKEALLTADPPTEIDEEKYIESLEVLPPQHWVQQDGNSTFEMMEHFDGRVTSVYCRVDGRYFTFMAITRTPHKELIQRVRNHIKQLQPV